MGSLLYFSGTARELAAWPPVSFPMEGTAPGFAHLVAEHLSDCCCGVDRLVSVMVAVGIVCNTAFTSTPSEDTSRSLGNEPQRVPA